MGKPATTETLGVPSPSNVPGYRALATTWTDSSGNLWLFGGSAPSSATNGSIHLNDLWEFNPDTNQWTWMSGYDNTVGGVYGTLGVPAAANVPGARQGAMGWADSSGNLWLFGGTGYDSAKTSGILNDLWKFNPTTKQWTWIGGSSTVPNANDCQPSIYGNQGVALANNVPGGRSYAASWTDANGNFWLFGGPGCDSGSNTSTCGLKTSSGNCVENGEYGVYGTLRVSAPVNVPGSRYDAASWSDRNGHLWLFGGEGFDSIGSLSPLNDLWEYQLKQNAAMALTSSASPVFVQNPVTLTASVTATGAALTGTVTFLDGTTSIGTGILNSSGSATLSVNNLTVGSHTITASYAGDANYAAAKAPLTEVVEDFSIAAGAITTATISRGGSATYTFTFNPIAPATTFPSGLTLSASGGPAGSTYTLSPTTITSGAGSTLLTVTVAVPSNSGSLRITPRRPEAPLSLPFALATLLMPLVGRLRKASKWTRGIASLLLIAAGIAASASLSGCSGGSSATTSQPQTYTIKVSGTAGALSHSTFVTCGRKCETCSLAHEGNWSG